MPTRGLDHSLNGESVIEVATDAKVQQPVAFGDLVLSVERELLDVGLSVPEVVGSAAGKIVREQHRIRRRR